jgi:hypothetical protein
MLVFAYQMEWFLVRLRKQVKITVYCKNFIKIINANDFDAFQAVALYFFVK